MKKLKILRELIELNAVPIARTLTEGAKVIIELDGDDQKILAVFSPYQALRITTVDCFPSTSLQLPSGMVSIPRAIMEVEESDWIAELKESLAEADVTADFMDKSHHYLVPGYDEFIEIAAWNVEYGAK